MPFTCSPPYFVEKYMTKNPKSIETPNITYEAVLLCFPSLPESPNSDVRNLSVSSTEKELISR